MQRAEDMLTLTEMLFNDCKITPSSDILGDPGSAVRNLMKTLASPRRSCRLRSLGIIWHHHLEVIEATFSNIQAQSSRAVDEARCAIVKLIELS